MNLPDENLTIRRMWLLATTERLLRETARAERQAKPAGSRLTSLRTELHTGQRRTVPNFLTRLLVRYALLSGWMMPIVVVVAVFVTSWPLMALAEPADSDLVQPENYWWYFVVTAATVGYGDLYPQTGAGHAVGAYVILGGIATLTAVFARLASVLERARGRRMQGAITVNTSGHTLLLGHTPGRTARIVDQLLADESGGLVLCAWDDVATHPMPERDVTFVRGDLTEQKVLKRAGAHRARAVLIDARDDNEALAIAVTVDHVNPDTHVVVTLRDMERASLLRYVNQNIRCVQWHTLRMISEELTSPGIAEVYTELMTHGGANTYSVALPASAGTVLVERCQTELGRRHGATVLAVRTNGQLLVNPSWNTEMPPGTILYYISPQRLTSQDVARALQRKART
jgi:voltage-gated potassium channel